MRWTDERLRPVASASRRTLHPRPSGGDATSARSLDSVSGAIDGFRPRPFASRQRPEGPPFAYRICHKAAVLGLMRSCRAMSRVDVPSPANNTICARRATR